MTYYTDLCSPETYEAFSKSDRNVSGFRIRQLAAAERIMPGDKFVCYMTKLSRWVGILEVLDVCFQDDTPRFIQENDPFVVRFKVKPIIWLEPEKAVPIRDDICWTKLSFTRNLDKNSSAWTGKLRSSLNLLSDSDGELLEELMKSQANAGKLFPIDEHEYKKLITHKVRRPDGVVTVTVPDDSEAELSEGTMEPSEVRESIKIQALLANIGATMGLKIWIPRSDRGLVLAEWKMHDPPLLSTLPLSYDDTTLRTIEQIDVLWLKGRAIVRAFEVEHTTSIYSGILRMADLLALQPNMDIKLHIVAPLARRDKVFQELRRPVFSLLEKGPLSDSCTYLSYDNVRDLSNQQHLTHLSDGVLDEYTEEAEEE